MAEYHEPTSIDSIDHFLDSTAAEIKQNEKLEKKWYRYCY